MKTSFLESLSPQYIVDDTGKRSAVILDVKVYERLLEELEDFYLSRAGEDILSQDEERISIEEVKRNLLDKNKK
jgi:predicted DNA-binding protein